MFAVIQTGGKQYRVAEGDVLRVEKLDGDIGATLEFAPLLVVGESAQIGEAAAGNTVTAEVVDHGRGKKIYIVKYKSGVQYRRRNGHRQDFTAIRITGIQ